MAADLLRPVSARPVGWARIGVGVAAVARALDGAPLLLGLADPQLLRVPYAAWWIEPTRPVVVSLLVLWVAAGAAFTIGYRTRIAGWTLLAAIAVVLSLDQQTYSNHLYLMALIVLLLTTAGPGGALSVDAARGRGSPFADGTAVFLLKAQVSIVYFFAGLWKINEPFLSGAVLAGQLGSGPVPFPEILRTPSVLAVVAAATVVTEMFIAAGLWLRRYRSLSIGLAVLLHGAIVVFMAPTVQLVVFAVELVVLYPLFFGDHTRVVVWDDTCSFCKTWVQWFLRLDWFRFLEAAGSSSREVLQAYAISRTEADTAMQFIDGRERSAGFEAVRRILGLLPVTYLVAPFLGLPGVRHLGDRLYRRVAVRRHCTYELPSAMSPKLPTSAGDD